MSLDAAVARVTNLIQFMRHELQVERLKGGQERQDTLHDIQALEQLVGAARRSEATVSIADTATAEKILDAIDAWAVSLQEAIANREEHGPTDEQKEGERLWWLLTALRGPDSEDHDVKLATTAVIRGAILPNLSELCGALHARKVTWEQLEAVGRRNMPRETLHFVHHVQVAATTIVDYFGRFAYRNPKD